MARMIPSSVRDFHGSQGEERVFYALRSLPDDVTVIHSFRWLHPGNARLVGGTMGAQGEGDFVLFDPRRGIMVIEVKGGEVWCEAGEWRQKNRRTGQVGVIFPEVQAGNTVHRIRLEIMSRVPSASSLLFCHAVWFPDGCVDRARLPLNCHPDIVLDADDISRPEAAVQKAYAYWRGVLPGRSGVNAKDAGRVLDALAPTFSLVRSVRQTLAEREERLVQLTHEQARIVHFLDEQRHAANHGAAGTGKTMVALEKARRLASPSEPVLFLCYNAGLRRHLESHHAQPNVRYLTFHGLARELIGPDGTLQDAEAELLAHLIEEKPLPYTHLIIDEGQDFRSEWLEYLAHRFLDGVFYVFYDRHQLVQGDKDCTWLDNIPCRLVLHRNCRNTDQIARVAYRAAGLSAPPTLGVNGPRPVLHAATDEADAIRIATALVEAAFTHHKAPPDEIAILTLETLPQTSSWRCLRLCGRATAEDSAPGCVTLTTTRRFKGLEAGLVIVTDADFRQTTDLDWRRRLYVACSRARHAVHIITTTKEADLGPALRALADTEKVRPVVAP